MKKENTIVVLGGDRRQHYAAAYLAQRGYAPLLWGMGEENASMEEMLSCAEVVLLPLPTTADGIRLHAPHMSQELRPTLHRIVSCLPEGCYMIGGRIPQDMRADAAQKGITVWDYFESEAFQIRNAYTTAEAALSIAMNHLTRNVREARIAITGYGRIAKQLSELFLRLGADVTVAARKESDLVWAQVRGCRALRLPEEGTAPLALAHGFDVIFNTVPKWLFDRAFLEQADKNTLYVELASAPGGIDVCAAKELVCNVCWAMSLPGKYAPRSAGEMIGACVESYLQGEGEI